MGIAGAVHGQTVVYVDASAPGIGNGQSWQTAFSNLQTALSTINGQQLRGRTEFRVARGTYTPDVLAISGAGFTIAPGTIASAATVEVRGGYFGRASTTPDARDFVSAATVLSGDVMRNDGPDTSSRSDNAASVVHISLAGNWLSMTLDGMTIQGGHLGAGFSGMDSEVGNTGGGVQALLSVEDGLLQISNCTIVNNTAWTGGGGISLVRSHYGDSSIDVIIQSCTIRHNETVGRGGGIHVMWPFSYASPLQVVNCTIEDNAAYYGGGIHSYARDIDIVRSRICGNTASDGSGGGMYAPFSHCLLSSSIVSGNSCPFGNGGGVYASSLVGTNSTVVDNFAPAGAGIHAYDADLTNCVFGLNRRPSRLDDFMISGGLTVSTSVFRLEYQSNGRLFGGGTLSPDSTGIFSFDPQFIDPDGPDNNPATCADNNFRLSPRSPAVDAGILDTSLSIVDLDGNDRFVSGMIGRPSMLDLGCYESQLTLCPADIDADGGVTIDDLLDFLVAFEAGQPLADLTSNGTMPFPDGGVTIDDLLFFLAKFEQGC